MGLELHGRLNSLAKRVAVDAALGHDTTVDDHDGHAPVVEGVEQIIGVNVAELRLDAKRSEGGQSFIA